MIDFSRKSTQEEQVYKNAVGSVDDDYKDKCLRVHGGRLHKSERIKQSGVQII